MVGRNNLLLLDEPTNNLDPRSRASPSPTRSSTGPGRSSSSATTPSSSSELAPTKVLLMPDGDVDYFSDDWLDLVAWPDAAALGVHATGTVRAHAHRDLRRTDQRRHASTTWSPRPGRPRPTGSTRSGRRRSSATTRSTALAIVGREVPRIELGTSVVPTYPRHPMMLAQQALTVNVGQRRPADPRHRAQPPDRHRVDDGHELRQAGAPPPRVPDHARPAVARRAGRLPRRDVPRPRGDLGAGHGAVPDRRRRARPADAEGRPPSWPTAPSRGAPGPDTLADHTMPTINAAAEAAGRPAPRVIAGAPGLRHRRRRRGAASGRPRCSRCTASCRATGRCSTARAPAGPPTSPSSGRPAEVIDRIGALADIGVTDFAAVEFGGDPDEVAATRAALVESLAG